MLLLCHFLNGCKYISVKRYNKAKSGVRQAFFTKPAAMARLGRQIARD
jgi:hypothetical protein